MFFKDFQMYFSCDVLVGFWYQGYYVFETITEL